MNEIIETEEERRKRLQRERNHRFYEKHGREYFKKYSNDNKKKNNNKTDNTVRDFKYHNDEEYRRKLKENALEKHRKNKEIKEIMNILLYE
jgi:hypothetical protein